MKHGKDYFTQWWKQKAKWPAAEILWLHQPIRICPFSRLISTNHWPSISITLNNKIEAASTSFLICQCCFLSKSTVASSISSQGLYSSFSDIFLNLTWTQSKHTNRPIEKTSQIQMRKEGQKVRVFSWRTWLCVYMMNVFNNKHWICLGVPHLTEPLGTGMVADKWMAALQWKLTSSPSIYSFICKNCVS